MIITNEEVDVDYKMDKATGDISFGTMDEVCFAVDDELGFRFETAQLLLGDVLVYSHVGVTSIIVDSAFPP